jgi:hypothetical protein
MPRLWALSSNEMIVWADPLHYASHCILSKKLEDDNILKNISCHFIFFKIKSLGLAEWLKWKSICTARKI